MCLLVRAARCLLSFSSCCQFAAADPDLEMLQVLISIQSMILVNDPYFNEPGYESSRATALGKQANDSYNKEQQMNTLAHAILPALKQPDPCFAEIIK